MFFLVATSIVLIFILKFLLNSKRFYVWVYDHFYPKILLKVKYNSNAKDPAAKRIDGKGCCYPKCASDVWLRSCEKEVIEPIEGCVSGSIPTWLNGSLLRNGPGNWKVGDMSFQHLFDCSALLHRFSIRNGKVTYQNRFIQTETLKKNTAAQRIVVTEFGTASVPDPCHSIFDRFSSIFHPESGTDNSMISIYPFGDEYYSFAETPFVHKINPRTLETEGRVCLTECAGVINHTSHPHVMKDGTVYNQGMAVTKTGIVYKILCFPHGEKMFENVHVVGSVPSRWKLNPGYMHTFGVTENYFVIVEQPLSVSVPDLIKAQLCNQNLSACLKWFDNKPTLFHLVDRKTGQLAHTFQSEAFFYLHIINQYEENDHLIIDICCYKDPEMINCMYLESIMNMQNNPDYASLFRSRPLRFVLPLKTSSSACATLLKTTKKLVKSLSLSHISAHLLQPKLKQSESHNENISQVIENNSVKENGIIKSNIKEDNLVSLENSQAEAYKLPNQQYISVKPELICDVGCETPRINYERYLGKKYRYFYAISCDVDADRPGMLIKVDTLTAVSYCWFEADCYPSEPIFVPSPNSKDEDDGVILSAMVWGGIRDNYVGLLVLCAKTWKELGRCEFRADRPVPKCLHGWFVDHS